jgi:hypothetical protein
MNRPAQGFMERLSEVISIDVWAPLLLIAQWRLLNLGCVLSYNN